MLMSGVVRGIAPVAPGRPPGLRLRFFTFRYNAWESKGQDAFKGSNGTKVQGMAYDKIEGAVILPETGSIYMSSF